MKFTIEKEELLTGLNKISGVAEKNTTLAILSNIMIDVNDNKLKLTASDMVLEVSDVVECQSEVNGKTTVNAYMFHDIIKRLSKDNKIEFELKENLILNIKSGRSKFNIGVLETDGFPVIDTGGYNTEFKLSKDNLNSLINKVKYASSVEETRYYLNGICWHGGNGELKAVATDGHRLAVSSVNVEIDALDNIIIPTKACNVVSKIIDSVIGDVNVFVGEGKIKFEFSDGGVLITKLIDGKFPDYERIIPANNVNTVNLNTLDFLSCINRVSSVLDKNSNSVKLHIQNDILSIMSANGGDTASDELSCVSDGLNLKIGFNVKYIIDALMALDKNTVIHINDSDTAILMKSENDDNFINVVMPLRV